LAKRLTVEYLHKDPTHARQVKYEYVKAQRLTLEEANDYCLGIEQLSLLKSTKALKQCFPTGCQGCRQLLQYPDLDTY